RCCSWLRTMPLISRARSCSSTAVPRRLQREHPSIADRRLCSEENRAGRASCRTGSRHVVRGRLLVRRGIWEKRRFALNLCRRCCDILVGRGIFLKPNSLEPDMSKAVRVSPSISPSRVSSRESDNHQLISIALFSGIGLLVSLVAVLLGVQGM